MKREAAWDQIRASNEPFDLLIVGGGATGLGCAVDAASRGHRVLLMEQGDFAQGTSSRSTKLAHGGVRYLKQGNLPLVLGALRERGLLLRNAPHLVHNSAFVIPAYREFDRWFYGAGLKLYDRLAGRLSFGSSRMLGREDVLAALPTIAAEGLRGGVLYHDGQFDDARLAIHLAQTAVDHGACVINYLKCAGLITANGNVCGVRARDMETGTDIEIRARAVINATGVFVDAIRRDDDPEAEDMVAPSQGIHLVLPKTFLPGDTALMIPKTSDGRVLFCVPWHDRVVVGTTDTPLRSADAEPRALPEEREFLMEHAAHYLEKAPAEDDVLSIFAGLRPLVKAGDGRRSASLSRDHTIRVSSSGLVTVTGGKWTTYRKMGEDVVNRAEQIAGLEPRACVSANLRLHGWTEDPGSVYGSDAEAMRETAGGNPDLLAPLHSRLPSLRCEVLWHVRAEMARSVEDVLARRTRALFLDAAASAEAAESTARLMAPELGKDETWIRQQTQAYETLARGYTFTDPASQRRA